MPFPTSLLLLYVSNASVDEQGAAVSAMKVMLFPTVAYHCVMALMLFLSRAQPLENLRIRDLPNFEHGMPNVPGV